MVHIQGHPNPRAKELHDEQSRFRTDRRSRSQRDLGVDVPRTRPGRGVRLEPQPRADGDQPRSRHDELAAHLDRRRLHRRAGRSRAAVRRTRRSTRPTNAAARRHDRVRPRGALCGRGAVARSAHRLSRRDGRRCGDDHARHPVDDHRGVPCRQARPGGQRVGRLRELWRDPRLVDLRADPRVGQLAGDVRRHRGPRRGRPSSPPWCSPRTRQTPRRP